MYSCFKPQIQVENLQHQACAQDRGWKDIYDIHIQDMVSHPRGTRSPREEIQSVFFAREICRTPSCPKNETVNHVLNTKQEGPERHHTSHSHWRQALTPRLPGSLDI